MPECMVHRHTSAGSLGSNSYSKATIGFALCVCVCVRVCVYLCVCLTLLSWVVARIVQEMLQQLADMVLPESQCGLESPGVVQI